MKSSKSLATALLVGAMATTLMATSSARAQASTGATFNVDPVHSMVLFRIQHMSVSYTYGMFWEPTGSYSLNFESPSNSSLSIELSTEKIDTGSERRDDHLRSPDFFNSKQFPTITFEATSFEAASEGVMKVEGELSMIGQTHPASAMIEFVDEGDTRQGHKSGFEANFTIKRSQWGMDAFIEGGGLGDEITLFVTVEGLKAE